MKSKMNFILALLLVISVGLNVILLVDSGNEYEEIEITDVYYVEETSVGFLVKKGAFYGDIIKMSTSLSKDELFVSDGSYSSYYKANAVIYENNWCVPYEDYDKMTQSGYKFGERNGIVGWYK
jgi:hypothetical protein